MWFLESGMTFENLLARMLAIVVIAFFVLPFHEYAQGLIAYKLGDDTPKLAGRLTLNPMAHFSGFGAVWLLLFDYGWAHRIPINPNNFRKPKRDLAIIGIAGPISYLFASVLGGFLLNFMTIFVNKNIINILTMFIFYYISINISLAVFNLIPIFPMDGFKIIQAFIPQKFVEKFYRNYHTITWVIIILMLFGFFSPFMTFLERILYKLIIKITCFI